MLLSAVIVVLPFISWIGLQPMSLEPRWPPYKIRRPLGPLHHITRLDLKLGV